MEAGESLRIKEVTLMENAGYLFAALGVIWTTVFVYVLVLFNRQKRLQREIDSLKLMLSEKGSAL